MDTQLDQSKSASIGHSSTVTMSLHIGSATFRVLQSSKDAIKLLEADTVPSGDAMLETMVDGRSHRRAICVLTTGPRPKWISIVDR